MSAYKMLFKQETKSLLVSNKCKNDLVDYVTYAMVVKHKENFKIDKNKHNFIPVHSIQKTILLIYLLTMFKRFESNTE